jgi:large repetitive protein
VKTLKHPGKLFPLAVVVLLLSAGELLSQCSVNAGPDVTKCLNQSFNPGPFVTTSGTTGAVTYSWNGTTFNATPNTSLVPPTTGATTYTLTIQDASGCVATDQLTINVLPLPTINAGADLTICSGTPTSLCATATSPNGPITLYTWTGGPPSQCWNIAPTAQATYTVTAVDASQCQRSDQITVFINPLPTVSAGVDQAMCLSQGTLQLTGSPAGGTWTGTGVSASGLYTASSVTTANLTYTASNSNGCFNNDQMQISVTSPAPIDGGSNLSMCLNTSPVTLPAVGTWSGSASVSPAGIFTPNASGIHNLTVTSGTGSCLVTDNVVIEVFALPAVNAGNDVSICTGGSVVLMGSASSANGALTTINWSGGSVSDNSILQPTASPSTSQVYILEVTDIEGCMNTDQVSLTVNSYTTVNAGSDITTCSNGGPTTVIGSPAGGTWTGSGVNPAGVFTPGATGNFTLTYSFTNTSGCTTQDQMTVNVIAPGSVNAGNDVTICLNSTPHQLLSGGTWTGSSWVTSAGLFTPGTVGTYVLTYTASTGQCMASDQIQVLVLDLPTANAGTDQSVCLGTQVQLNATGVSPNGAITAYTWTAGTVSNSLVNNPVATPMATTTYTVVASDAFGCSDSDQITVVVNNYPTVEAGNNINVCINGGAITLGGFSPAGGTWAGSGVTAAGVFTPTSLGNVNLTYSFTSPAGCSSSDVMTVSVISGGTIDAGDDLEICLNSSTVQLAGGGIWSGSSLVTSSGLFTPSSVGSYTLNYSAMSAGCMASDQIEIHVLALPVANAGADISACEQSTVSLNASGSSTNGGITGYSWIGSGFSNPNISNPTYQLTQDVTLTVQVTDASGCTATDLVAITANPLPVINAGADQVFCDQGIDQQLIGFSPTGGTWTGNHVNATGVFDPTAVGSFPLTYTFTNAFNCTATDHITVNVVSTTMANAGADMSVCEDSPAFQLVAITPGGNWTAGAYWDAMGNFNPTTSGTFSVSYTMGSGSCANSDTRTITVHALPAVNAGPDLMVCEGESIQLNSIVTGQNPFEYSWNNPSLLNHPDYPNPTASASADTWFTLTVTDDNGCVSSDAVFVDVVPMPHAAFSAPDVACENTNVLFTNNSTNSVTYAWSLGNSSSSTSANPSTTYLMTGVYTVELTAFNAAGCEDVISETIEIISAPHALFDASVSSGCTPLSVSFENQSSGSMYSSEWDLGGTSYSGEMPPVSLFTAATAITSYEITLTVANICGSDVYAENIVVDPAPTAAFSTDLSSQCSPVTTVFNNNSAGNPQSFHWDLGDGETSDDAVPTPKVYVTEDDSEIFTITLTAYNQCGTDSESADVLVLPNTVQMDLQPSVPAGCSPLFVEFENNTTGATNFLFEFGDNSSSTLMSPNHIFANAGEYEVVFYANDGCSFDTTSLTITVVQSPSISISVEENAVCPFTPAHFHSTPVGNIAQTEWLFGDGLQAIAEDPEHAFSEGNIYYVSATTYDLNGCPATATLEFEVYPQPDAQMALSSNEACSPATICTDNQSNGSIMYAWNFGNGFTSNNEDACYEFINEGNETQNFLITLGVENEFGCTDQTEQNLIILPQPLISFTLSSEESCLIMQNITTTSTNQNAVAYEWFADGQMTSQDANPAFQFDEVGSHEIYVIAYNDFGCSDVHQEVYVIHPTPVIDIMPEVFNGCAPLSVAFENETTEAVSWAWSFSNGAHSNMEFPVVTFNDAGKYDVQLIAISEHGCQQVQYFDEMIEVFPVPVADFTMDPDDDVIYDLDVTFTNTSQGADNYFWNFGDGYTERAIDPVHHYNTGGYFIVTLTSENAYGCSSEIQKPVNIDNTFYMFMPNSFTPDDDGLNDVFMPEFSSTLEIKTYEFVVMNRWGEIVFKTNDPKDGWVGSVRGGEHYAHNDMFNWTVEIDFNNKQVGKSYKGSVLVLR